MLMPEQTITAVMVEWTAVEEEVGLCVISSSEVTARTETSANTSTRPNNFFL